MLEPQPFQNEHMVVEQLAQRKVDQGLTGVYGETLALSQIINSMLYQKYISEAGIVTPFQNEHMVVEQLAQDKVDQGLTSAHSETAMLSTILRVMAQKAAKRAERKAKRNNQ